MSKSTNQRDIARALGVTQAAVSMALKNHPGLSEELKAQVRQMCETMGYRPNYNAVSLSKKETKVISVVMAWLLDLSEGLSRFVGYLQREVNERGYKFRLDQGYVLADIVAERSADGFIVIDNLDGYDASMGDRFDVPMIYGGGGSRPLRCNSVPMDNYGGAYDAVRHLIHLGHRSIAFFGLIDLFTLCVERYRGYRDAMNSIGGGKEVPEPISTPNWLLEPMDVESFSDKVLEYVKDGVTAFLASSDIGAIGIVRLLASRGLRVPEDVSVIGFDDSTIGRAWLPALTSVHLDNALAASTVVSDLISILRNPREIEGKIIPSQLVVRSTTGPVRKRI